MGFIIDTQDEILGLERRRGSYGILDLQRKFVKNGSKSKHIFAYADGEIEISNEFLNRLLKYFEQHPKERYALAQEIVQEDQ